MRSPANDNRTFFSRSIAVFVALAWRAITIQLAVFWSFVGMWIYDLF
ncbi:hypothetical protein [Fulvimarina sp. MAC8]